MSPIVRQLGDARPLTWGFSVQLDHVICIGGFSKTVSASLRVSYRVTDKALVKDLADVKMLASVADSHRAEATIAALLKQGGYRKYVERLRLRVRKAWPNTVCQLKA
jgi:DNA-binding transcriptional MocR family regulator